MDKQVDKMLDTFVAQNGTIEDWDGERSEWLTAFGFWCGGWYACQKSDKTQDILEDKNMAQFDQGYAEFYPTAAKIELSDHTNFEGYSGDITACERVNWADHSMAVIYGPDFEEIMIWLNNIIQDGVGSILLSLTDDGDVGVWFPNPDDDKPIGTGGDVVEALHSAQHCWNEHKEAAVIRHAAKSGCDGVW